MTLDLEDRLIRVRLRTLSDGNSRLVLDYPSEPRYRDAVLTALADLIRPASPPPKESTLPREGGDTG